MAPLNFAVATAARPRAAGAIAREPRPLPAGCGAAPSSATGSCLQGRAASQQGGRWGSGSLGLSAIGLASLRRRRLRYPRAPRLQVGEEVAAVVAVEEEEADEDVGAKQDMVSPFQDGQSTGAEPGPDGQPKLPLTMENVEMVLDEVRPYLINDGGNCQIIEIDGPIVKLEMQGSCSSCSASSVTLKMGIERKLMERIPEIAEVVSVDPEQEPLTEEGVEEVLNGIRPFLSVSGGAIELAEMEDGDNPSILLCMTGPPFKSMAVKVEVVNRMKRKYPHVMDVEIIKGED